MAAFLLINYPLLKTFLNFLDKIHFFKIVIITFTLS